MPDSWRGFLVAVAAILSLLAVGLFLSLPENATVTDVVYMAF